MSRVDPFGELVSRSYLREQNQQQSSLQTDNLQPFDKLLTQRQVTQEPSYYDQTVGAALYGGADALRLLSENVGQTLDIDYLKNLSRSLKSFQDENPQYRPEEVKDAFDLATNPKALIGRIAGTAPFLLATIGLTALPGGIGLAAGLTYAVESQRFYDQAKQDGASEDEALFSSRLGGLVNTALNTVAVNKLVGFANKTAYNTVLKTALGEAKALSLAGGQSLELAGHFATQGVIAALQGSASELIPKGVYHKDVEGDFGDFLNRRLTDVLSGGVMASVFGLAGRGLKLGPDGKPSTEQTESGQSVNVFGYNRESLKRTLVLNRGLPEDVADAFSTIVENRAVTVAKAVKGNPEQYFTQYARDLVKSPEPVQGPVEQHLAQDPVSVTQKELEIFQAFTTRGGDETAGVVETGKPQETKTSSSGRPKQGVLTEKNVSVLLTELQDTLIGSLPQDQQQALLSLYPQGRKKITSEEQVSQAFQKWLRTGEAPSSELVPAFKTLRGFITGTWGTLKEQGIKTGLSTDAKSFFDSLLTQNNPTIEQQIATIKEIEQQLSETKTAKTKGESSGNVVPGTSKPLVDALRKQLKVEKLKLEELQAAKFDSSLSDELENAFKQRTEAVKYQTPETIKLRSSIQRGWDFVSSLFDLSKPLQRFEPGKVFVEKAKDVAAGRALWRGRYEQEIISTYKQLSSEDIRWMTEIVDGETRFQRAFDTDTISQNGYADVPSEAVKRYGELSLRINKELGAEAQKIGLFTRRKDGSIVPYEQPEGQRVPRILTFEARAAIKEGRGELFDGLLKWVVEHNEGVSLTEAKTLLNEQYGSDAVERGSSSLEYSRKIKRLPAVVEVNNRQIAIQHIDPLDLVRRQVDLQGHRIEWTKQFGQNLTDIVDDSRVQNLAKALGMDVKVPMEALRKTLETAIGTDEGGLSHLSDSDVRKLAKSKDINTSLSREELVNRIFSQPPTELKASQQNAVRAFAKKIGGIKLTDGVQEQFSPGDIVSGPRLVVKDVPRDFTELFNDVKNNIGRPPTDLYTRLREDYVKFGGDLKDFDRVAKLAQGIPIQVLERNQFNTGVKLASQVWGSLQTSLAAIPNLTQTPQNVAALSGIKNYLQAVQNHLQSPYTTVSDVTAFTGLYKTVFKRQVEPGNVLEDRVQQGRQVLSRVFGFEQVNDFNRYVAGEAFKLKAMEWSKDNGFGKEDVPTARSLGLSQAEIDKALAAGNIKVLGEKAFTKVVLTGVTSTQHLQGTGLDFQKGLVENSPLGKLVFSYSSYVFGQARLNADLLKRMSEAVKSKDYKTFAETTQQSVTWLAANVGAGLAVMVLRAAIKGQTEDVEEQLSGPKLELTFRSLNEVAGFGIFSRFFDSYRNDGGVPERLFTGFTPQIAGLVKFYGAVAGYGKLGELPLDERLASFGESQVPALKALNKWIEDFAYPEKSVYEETTKKFQKFNEEQTGQGFVASNNSLNPWYYKIFQSTLREDFDGARSLVSSYIQDQVEKGVDPLEALRGVRQSLLGRAPVKFSDKKAYTFYLSLPAEERERALSAQLRYKAQVDQVVPKF